MFWEPKPKTKRQTVAEIRGHLAAFGCPVEGLSDEEIEAGCVRLGEAAVRFGLSFAEFRESPLNSLLQAGCRPGRTSR